MTFQSIHSATKSCRIKQCCLCHILTRLVSCCVSKYNIVNQFHHCLQHISVVFFILGFRHQQEHTALKLKLTTPSLGAVVLWRVSDS